MIQILKINGADEELFPLVAPLVMNEKVLAYNLNYPYRTSSNFEWFIATDQGETLGFIPVKLKGKRAIINNYYVADDNNQVFSSLLKKVRKEFLFGYEIEAIVQTKHIAFFEENDFMVEFHWRKFVRMTVIKNYNLNE